MSRSNTNSARLPLFEAVLAVAIFVLASVILLRLYMSADRLQGEAVAVSKAMIAAENAAEQFSRDGSFREVVFLNRDFKEDGNSTAYELKTRVSGEAGNSGTLQTAVITLRDIAGDKVLCELNAAFISKE